jgi:sigma-E factor negative regulatory protein RseA
MNEELDSQLSAMFDDQLPQGECELLARRLSRDAALQARWDRYAAIGAAVRGGDVRLGCRVVQKVTVALAAEAPLVKSGPMVAYGARATARWWRPLAGAAVAASVAALSILWLRGGVVPGSSGALVARVPAAARPLVDTRASYVVPRTVESRMSVPATELANYVVAHSEFSTPVSRRNLLSALMTSEPAASGPAEQSLGSVDDPNHHADEAH